MAKWEYVNNSESIDDAVEWWLKRPGTMHVVVRLHEENTKRWYDVVVVTKAWLVNHITGLTGSNQSVSYVYIPHGLLVLPDATGAELEGHLNSALSDPGVMLLAKREHERQVGLSG